MSAADDNAKEIHTFHIGGCSSLPIYDDAGGVSGFEVEPITDCPHLSCLCSEAPSPEAIKLPLKCRDCHDDHGGVGASSKAAVGKGDEEAEAEEEEVWVCGSCHNVGCSRFINGHALQHYDSTSGAHPISISWRDLSAYCYACDSYLNTFLLPALHPLFRALHRSKFDGEEPALPHASASAAGRPSGGAGAGTSASAGAGAASEANSGPSNCDEEEPSGP